MFQISRCAMMLGCTLPNRLLIGIFTFRIGSQMNQPCSFQMVCISFQMRLALGEIERGDHAFHQLIDARLFRRGRLLLPDEPVVRDARSTDRRFCAFAGSGGTPLCEPEQDGLVLEIVAQVRDRAC